MLLRSMLSSFRPGTSTEFFFMFISVKREVVAHTGWLQKYNVFQISKIFLKNKVQIKVNTQFITEQQYFETQRTK